MMVKKILHFVLCCVVIGCGNEADEPKVVQQVEVKPKLVAKPIETPPFSADSCYQFVSDQVNFGPRVPGSDASMACADYFRKKFKAYGLDIMTQRGKVTTYNNRVLDIQNITAKYKPNQTNRIMLCAHWDTRPYADRGTSKRMKPIDGANDGASGVAVLLEIARLLQDSILQPKIGIDFVLFDAEDYGKPSDAMSGLASDSYCLGSQFWSKSMALENQKPKYGILLDMVGAENAVFPKEAGSVYFAKEVVQKVWSAAQSKGHSDLFINQAIGSLTDDHLYINEIARIPTIDIIHYEPARGDFGVFHHTHADNMTLINKHTLGAVGETLMHVIYHEN